ncbi:MAG: 7,8-didemethyl-8-hydroxy-5-deazariboflavin synthase subunit CofH, partial [Candidatus Nitrosopelagicus sp.]|nr:7,8-didemethyl-8-hydroxy-5-deazariboflavin synthase subunit CofH [Candidatus Nitrosopelagicus sp.]
SIGRIPAERDTTYQKIKKFEVEPTESEGLDGVDDVKKFGSYFELIKIKKYQYQNPREN